MRKQLKRKRNEKKERKTSQEQDPQKIRMIRSSVVLRHISNMADKREHMLSSGFREFVADSTTQSSKKQFGQIIEEAQLLQNDINRDIVTFINQCLSSSHRRNEGSQLLCAVLQQCNTAVFQQHAETWARLLLDAILSNDGYKKQFSSCHAMGKLLRESTAFPELSRSLSTHMLPRLLNRLLDFPSGGRELTLTMLMNCMKHYPGPCGLVRHKIEKFVVANIDVSDTACKAYSYVPHCGGSGNKGVKYTAAWTTSFQKLQATISEALDDLYGFVEPSSSETLPSAPFTMPKLPESQPSRAVQLSKRVRSLLAAMKYMLDVQFPAYIELPFCAVIDIVKRTLDTKPSLLLSRPTIERTRLASLLPSLHASALNVLNSLIRFSDNKMILLSNEINQMFLQSLMWISKLQPQPTFGVPAPYSGIHKAVWDSLALWVETYEESSGIEEIAEDVLKYGIAVVTPVEDNTPVEAVSRKMTEVSSMFQGKKGKKLKKHSAHDSGPLSSQRKINNSANSEVIISAWNAIGLVIEKVGLFLPVACYQAVHNVLLSVLVKTSSGVPPIPYARQPECLSAAYSVLFTVTAYPHPSWPAPVQLARALLSHQQHIPKSVVRGGRALLHNIIHPRAPSLQIPHDYASLMSLIPGRDAKTRNSKEKEEEDACPQMFSLPSQLKKKKQENAQPVVSVLANGEEESEEEEKMEADEDDDNCEKENDPVAREIEINDPIPSTSDNKRKHQGVEESDGEHNKRRKFSEVKSGTKEVKDTEVGDLQSEEEEKGEEEKGEEEEEEKEEENVEERVVMKEEEEKEIQKEVENEENSDVAKMMLAFDEDGGPDLE